MFPDEVGVQKPGRTGLWGEALIELPKIINDHRSYHKKIT